MIAQVSERLSVKTVVAYALPATVFALPTIPVYIHLPALYGDDLGLGLATTGLVLLLARIFDTLTDPIIGVLCDRWPASGTRRKLWILGGSVIAGIALVMVLSPPVTVSASYLLLWSVILYLGWTMIAVPYTAWGAELSTNYGERARITSWREGFALGGIILAAAVGTIAVDTDFIRLSETEAVVATALVLGLLFLPIMVICVPDPSVPGTGSTRSGWLKRTVSGIRSLRKNKLFFRILFAWFINGLANGIPAALFFLYLEYGLGVAENARPAYILAYFIAAISAIPLWLLLSKRVGKHRSWCIAMIVACLAFGFVPFLPPGAYAAFLVICVVTGAALGADLALPPAIQADVVDYDHMIHGTARTGLQFSLWGMVTKLSLALAVGTALPLLAVAGFDPSSPDDAGTLALGVIYAGLPVVLKTIAIAVVWGFPLTARKQGIIRRALDRRTTIRQEKPLDAAEIFDFDNDPGARPQRMQ